MRVLPEDRIRSRRGEAGGIPGRHPAGIPVH